MISESAATATTFNNQNAYSVTATITASLIMASLTEGEKTVPYEASDVLYETTSYQLIEREAPSVPEYAVPAGALADVPTTVSIGNAAILGTWNTYSDSVLTLPTGTVVESYVVQADPTNGDNCIVDFIEQTYNTSNVLTATTQVNFRVTASGGITLASEEVSSTAGGNTVNLTFTGR